MPNNQSVKIAIASGKGGTGKTFVATNLFNVLRKADRQVTLIDCDAEEPNVLEFISGEKIDQLNVTQEIPVIDTEACIYCGKCAEYCHYNAIFFVEDARIIQVMDDLCPGWPEVNFVTTPCRCPASALSKVTTGTEMRFLIGTVEMAPVTDTFFW